MTDKSLEEKGRYAANVTRRERPMREQRGIKVNWNCYSELATHCPLGSQLRVLE